MSEESTTPDLAELMRRANEAANRRDFDALLSFLDGIGVCSNPATRDEFREDKTRKNQAFRPSSLFFAPLLSEAHISIQSVGPEAYTRDESFKRQVLKHYEASLNAMVDIATAAKARLRASTNSLPPALAWTRSVSSNLDASPKLAVVAVGDADSS